MRLLLLIVFAVASIVPSFAQSQPEMTAQAQAEFDKADKELNEVYQKVLKSMDDDIAKQKLIAVQKAWIKYRDAQAELDADAERGGSLANQILAESETTLTKARTAELKKYLTDQTGK
jgi:uncharacterized protein YecT (DUF1311 family)